MFLCFFIDKELLTKLCSMDRRDRRNGSGAGGWRRVNGRTMSATAVARITNLTAHPTLLLLMDEEMTEESNVLDQCYLDRKSSHPFFALMEVRNLAPLRQWKPLRHLFPRRVATWRAADARDVVAPLIVRSPATKERT